MNAKDIVELIRAEKPAVLGKMSDRRATALVRNALIQVGRQIDSMPAGEVKVRGLGNFRVKRVERLKDDKKSTVKRVVFRPRLPKKKSPQAK